MSKFSLNRFIIHELVKGEDAPRTADELLDLADEIISSLATQIIELYEKKTSVIYGVFKKRADEFPSKLKSVYQKISDTEFLTLTENTMNSMQLAMKNTSGTGGYITFIEYKKGSVNYLLAVMIKNTKGFELKKLKPKEATRVDTSKLYQAININLNSFLKFFSHDHDSEVRSYISFISKAHEPSGYFLDAFSCRANVTPSKATISTPRAARDFLISCGVDEHIAKEAYNCIVDYLIEKSEKQVTLKNIHIKVNKYLPDDIHEENKDGFISFCKNDDYQIPEFFQSKGATARSLRQIKGKGDGWEVNFDRDNIGIKGVHVTKPFMYDPKLKQLTMMDIPADFRERIEEELSIEGNDDE